MKKLILSFAVAVAAVGAFSSCGSSEASKEADSLAVEAADPLDVKIDSATTQEQAKSLIDEATAYAQKLADEGKYQEAKDYIDKVKEAVKAKFPDLTSTLETATADVDSIKSAAEAKEKAIEEKTQEVKDAAADAKDKVDAAKQGVSDAAQNVKDAAGQAKDALNNLKK
ncbi:MAG: hypothetical protein LIP02_04815 [Bacteroidales bacterium]|nr:hypothetical protein [Bacteroidales bacterium]